MVRGTDSADLNVAIARALRPASDATQSRQNGRQLRRHARTISNVGTPQKHQLQPTTAAACDGKTPAQWQIIT